MAAAAASLIVIEPFEVPPGEDEAFLAAAEGLGGTLYRALRPDADFRFVHVARVGAPTGAPRPGRYEVVHEDGAPDGAEGATLIGLFEVPDDGDHPFLGAWDGVREVLAAQRGFLGTRLHRAAGPAAFRFVELTRWSSPLMVHRANALPELAEASAGLPFSSHRALYQVIRC
jgi:hypothetical protein